MTIAIERLLAWKLLPRVMMTPLPKAMTYQPTALTPPVTGAMTTGAFVVWLGHAK